MAAPMAAAAAPIVEAEAARAAEAAAPVVDAAAAAAAGAASGAAVSEGAATSTGAGAAPPREPEGEPTSVDVCILLDATGSMSSWIAAAKATAISVANDIRTSLPRGSVYRLAFVAYHDMGDSPRFELGPFNTDVEAILSQMRSVYARGGADEPEDVAGGLAEVLKFGWDAATKIVIHIADAPPHGHDYNDCGSGDSYPSGTTECPQPRELMRDLASRGIDYTFFKINHSTDKMLRVFSEAWNEGAADPERQSFTVMDMQHGTQGAESYPMVEAESSFGATVGMAMPCFDESIPMAVPTSSAYAAEADDCVPSLRSESEGERSAPIPRSMPSAMAYSSMAMPSMAMPSMAPMAPMAASAGMPSMARSAAAGPSFGEALTKSVMASVAKRRV